MNIISGKYKGMKLKEPKRANHTHPMGSREKLALMNTLSPYLDNAVVFDVFAGTGALGLEALSRGAKYAVFIDDSKNCTAAIKESLTEVARRNQQQIADFATVLQKKAESVNFSELPTPDIILIDPPYDDFVASKFQQYAAILPPGGVLALSHPGVDSCGLFPELDMISSKKYASCYITLFKTR